MNRPDIHDIRNKHLAEKIQQYIYEHGYPKTGEAQIAYIQSIIERHLTEMGLSMLDENGD